MKVVQINATCGIGSTGKICVAISKLLTANHIENAIFHSNGEDDGTTKIRYMSPFEVKKGALEARVRGNYGFNSKASTVRLVTALKQMDPDIVHLHNLHGHNCDLEILFRYLKDNRKKIIWTFHDCWAFTGTCTYFSYVNCEKWKEQCHYCPQSRVFSWFRDSSAELFERKKSLLADGLNMTIVSPSKWLADLTKESFLKSYPVEVIHNGIDLQVFHPTYSSVREQYGISKDQKMILGVAFDWGIRKGLDIFINLSRILPKDYRLLLVGTNPQIDKMLPASVISVHRTQNQKELAELYTAADVFVNPTREDNYPTVNMEALACGTPVITFDTGGSPESLDSSCGVVVKSGTAEDISKAIVDLLDNKRYSVEDCLQKAQLFDQNACFQSYIDLYRKVYLG